MGVRRGLQWGILLACLAAALPAAAVEDAVAGALKLYEKHRYEDALRALRPQLAGLDAASQPAARLALGMICLRNAELYQALQHGAGSMAVDYLQKLQAQKSRQPSRYADYFLGQALLANGQPEAAVKRLQRFQARPGLSAADKAQVAIDLGTAYWRQRQAERAEASWASVRDGQAGTRAALAAAYAEAGKPQAAALADGVVADLKKQGKAAETRIARNLLRTYAALDMPDKALDLLAEQEFRAAGLVENLGQSKSLSFYDADLLGSMAQAYADAAVQWLEQASRDSKLGGMASYYLADAWLLQGKPAQVQRQAAVLASASLPEAYRAHARSMQAAAQYLAGKRQEAQAAWRELSDQAGSQAELQAEVLLGCARAAADCGAQAQRTQAAADGSEGRKRFVLNAALGRYFLAHRDYVRAAQYLEGGRDKANKNKIEINDPVLLAGLAEAYYRGRQYSESLEIYFEMSKQFPALRQMQDEVQGIYAMEQQSAGDVKIF